MRDSNLILIGMPAAGKTTIGRLLAQRLDWEFIDTDRLLEARSGMSLPALLESRGLAGFRRAEEQLLLDLRAERSVIATGGSVVYGESGMAALARLGLVVYLHCELGELEDRVGDPVARGMVIAPGQSFAALYRERVPLYRRHAALEIACERRPPEVVADRVLGAAGLADARAGGGCSGH